MGNKEEALQSASLAYQRGELDRADQVCRRALDEDRSDATFWCMLGIVSRARGLVDDAVMQQEEALRLRPDFLEALNNLGNLHVLKRDYERAIGCYRRVIALRPSFAEVQNNLGAALRNLGRLDEASEHYREALRLRPEFPDALSNLGDLLLTRGEAGPASASYRRALEIAPEHASSLTGLGNALCRSGEFDEALAMHARAIRVRPDFAEAHCNLGKALAEQRRFDEAIASYRQAIRLRPDLAVAHYNLGAALVELGRSEDALACYEEALRLEPDSTEVLENTGVLLLNQGKPDQALARFERGVGRALDSPAAHMGRALIWLMKGDLERGFAEYEWRWKTKEMTPPAFAQPSWDGSDLEGKTILLHAEQGIGDTIQMIRYAALVKGRGGRVVVACQRALQPLLRSCAGIDERCDSDATPPPFDVHAPLLSLPRLFGTTLATVPAEIPYLAADPDLLAHWRDELSRQEGIKVGLVWQGNPKHPADRQRSFPLEAMEPVLKVEGIRFFSLQKGAGSEQVARLAGRFPIHDLGPTVDEDHGPFLDSAAILENLDVLMTSDTALAHLAGALGVPVWIGLSLASDWRWLLDREDSPWYPSARLFRQTRLGDWSGVFERMAEALRAWPGRASRPRTIAVEVAAGELIDRITILEIKSARIEDEAKRVHVRRELEKAAAVRSRALGVSGEIDRLAGELKAVNETLWDVEDEIRRLERDEDFGPRFIELARSVYRQNDRRASLKAEISSLAGSEILEQKQYCDYDEVKMD